MKKTKLICFDIDGTLTYEKSSFAALTKGLGCDVDKAVSAYQAVVRGEMSIAAGEELIAGLYKESGLADRESILRVFENVPLKKEAGELVSYLKAGKWKIHLISGGMDMFVEMVALRLGADGFCFNSALIFDQKGKLKKIVYGGDESEKKLKQIKELAIQYALPLNEIVFVGDSENDYGAFAGTGRGIAVKPFAEKLESVAWKTVDSLLEIKSLI